MARSGLVVLVALGCWSCSPSSPSDDGDENPGPPSLQCRSYTVGLLALHTRTGTTREEWTSSVSWLPYDTAANELSSTETSLRPAGANLSCQVEVRTTTQYASLADFIDEVAAIPPVARATRVVSTVTTRLVGPPGTNPAAPCGPPSSTATFTYDAQRRLTRVVEDRPAGGSSTFSYSAWDSARRPTAATVSDALGTATLTFTYDDNARTRTTRRTGGLGETVTTDTYDTNGTVVQSVSTGPGQSETYSASVLNAVSICR